VGKLNTISGRPVPTLKGWHCTPNAAGKRAARLDQMFDFEELSEQIVAFCTLVAP